MNTSKIRGLIVQKYGSARRIAEEIPLSETSLYQKLTGKSEFKVAELIRLSEILEVPVRELFVEENK